jgi:hypothetical protein
MALHTIQEGALVKVAPYKGSSGGVGVVKKKKRRLRTPEDFAAVFAAIHAATTATGGAPAPPSPGYRFDIKYTGVETRLTQDVSPSRVASYSFSTTARKRGGAETRPSLLSTSHQPIARAAAAVAVPKPRKETPGCTPWLIEQSKKKGSKYRGGNKAIAYLFNKRETEGNGWLRQLEARLTGRNIASARKPTDEEKNLALKLYMSVYSSDCAAKLVACAWGVGRHTIYNWKAKADESPTMTITRKPRNDIGQTLFNSDMRRAAAYTPANIGPQRLFAARAKEGETISRAQATEAYAEAPDDFKAETTMIIASFKERSPFLLAELKRVLTQTNGSISWAALARALNGDDGGGATMVSASTIRRFITSTPNFSYKTTRLLPFLNKGTKEKRYDWSMQFWVFWEGAKAFEGVQVLLVQMDEKWCYEIVVRKKEKSVPFFGVEPLVHGVQHKSHIGKVLMIASTGFLPINNDIAAGGKSVLIGLQRAGRMVAAERDTYKRVYAADGSYTYPKRLDNRLREKGKEYFQGMEITGSYKGTPKRPKYPLTEFFAEEIDRLSAIAQTLETQNGKRIVVRYQMDGAGPHRDKRLLRYLNGALEAKGWHLKFQPPNSPITNVKDACIFPSLSKRISAEQGLSNGGRLFSQDQLWAAIQLTWASFPLDVISRSYVMHHQVVNAIASCKGGDGFMREKNYFHANVRKCCVSTVDPSNGTPTGVEVVTALEESIDTDVADTRKFVYHKPDVRSYDPASLTEAEIDLLYQEMPVDHPLFGGISEAWALKQLEDDSDDD